KDAISAIEPSIIGNLMACAGIRCRKALAVIADAVRPGVVGVHAESGAEPVLDRQNQSIVALRSTRIEEIHVAEVRGRGRIDQAEQAALIVIRRRGAGGVIDAVQRAWLQT